MAAFPPILLIFSTGQAVFAAKAVHKSWAID
jgi:hypothetical protein